MEGPAGGIRDVGDADLEREVLERSRSLPVVVDFWAPWCAPCRTLGPVLETVAREHADELVLARINVDEAPGAAQAFGVRSIPLVLGLRDGRVVSELSGAQPESVVRRFVESLLPTEADHLAREGASLAEEGEASTAEMRLRAALEKEARHPLALVALARLLAERGEPEEALDLLDLVPGGAAEAREAERLAAALRTRAEGGGDEDALRERLRGDPEDLAARLALGRLLAAEERYAEALEELLGVVEREPHYEEDAARRAMLDLFEVLGSDHELSQRYRAALGRALFR